MKVETKTSGQAQKVTGKRSKTPTKKSITRKRTPTPAPSKKRIARKRSKTPTKKRESSSSSSSSGSSSEGEVQGEVKEEIQGEVQGEVQEEVQGEDPRKKSITGKKTPAPTFMIKSNHLLWAIIIINTATLSMMSSYAFNYFMN